MTHSKNFQKFKRLYYQEELPIKSTEINYNGESGVDVSAIFEDEDAEIEISGNSEDFTRAVMAVNKTVRDGEEMLIDLTDTPVKSTEGYYENMDLFIPNSENPLNDSVERVLSGKADIPDGVNLHQGLNASLDLDFENDDLNNIIENYDDCVGLQLIQLKQFVDTFEVHRDQPPITESRVMRYHEIAESVLRLEFLTKSPISGYRSYRENCISDVMFLSNRLLALRKNSEREWEAIHTAEGGSVEGSFGIYRLLQEYSSLFELMREQLIDLASVVEDSAVENVNVAIEILSDSKHSEIVEPIVPELRYGPAHFSIEFDDEKARVDIFEKRSRSRKLQKSVSYDEALEIYYRMRDLAVAIIYAFTLTKEVLAFEYLQSRDFMFRIIENSEAGAFSSNK